MKQYLRITIPRRHPAAILSCLLMAASALLRLFYYLPRELDLFTLLVQLLLPVLAACAFLTGMALGGSRTKAGVLTALVLGVAFFLIKATTFTPLHQALCTLLYLAVLVLFSATLMGFLPTKKLLYPLFGLPLLFHLFVEDPGKYFFAEPPVPVWDWLPEISVLCIMAGLLSLSVSLECSAEK
ncbi:MAG: hypothetical protein ACI4PH_03785 [Faecousia sp.]